MINGPTCLGGMDLIRRKERKQAFCLTVPLLVSSTGKKMGKTESGAIWLDPEMTSPYDFSSTSETWKTTWWKHVYSISQIYQLKK